VRRLLLALGLVLPLLAPAAARGDLRLGVQDDALLSASDPRGWALVGALRPAVVRFNVDWAAIAPTRPSVATDPADAAYRWDAVDRVVVGAAAAGAEPLLSVVDAPRWANGGRRGAVAPGRPADFGDFCAALATRYSGSYLPPGGAAPLPYVHRYTVWNEPNRGQYLRPQGRGGRLAARVEGELVRACQPAIHRSMPHALVALGPLASRGAQGGLAPLAFLRAYRAAGGPGTDAVALNPYLEQLRPVFAPHDRQPDGALTLRNLDQLEHALRRSSGHRVPVWLTEFSWRVADQPGLGDVTPRRQERLAAESVALVRRHYPYAELLVWFLLRDASPHGYWSSGLADWTLHRRPVFGLWAALDRRRPTPAR
jgi:hypothetical protein